VLNVYHEHLISSRSTNVSFTNRSAQIGAF